MTPHPLTIASIKLQGSWTISGTHRLWPCSCSQHPVRNRWYLCQYHQGYEDGIEAALQPKQ